MEVYVRVYVDMKVQFQQFSLCFLFGHRFEPISNVMVVVIHRFPGQGYGRAEGPCYGG